MIDSEGGNRVKRFVLASMAARLTRPVDGSQLVIRTSLDGALLSSAGIGIEGNSDVWGFTPNPLYVAGTWRYDLTDIGGNVLATGTVVAE